MNFLNKPSVIGLIDGKLAACPLSPNCVSTQTDQVEKRMQPISFAGSTKEAMLRLKEVIESMPRTRFITQTDNYLHVEFRSLLLRFVDDVEFLIDSDQKQIHFRSASRVGHSDLGVNRARMNQLSDIFKGNDSH